MNRIVVAMSGGVDSSVAAWLLKEKGLDVVGLFLRNGVQHAGPLALAQRQGCCSVDDSRDAGVVATRLGIPFYVVDYGQEFGAIIGNFVDSYRRGLTPNPCVECNRDLKFGALLDFARSIGAGAVATGHYAQLSPTGTGEVRLRRGAHREKDQSYVLAAMHPDTLRSAQFPVGDLRKPDVRALAKKADLPVFDKRESQEICFVPSNDYRDLLDSRGVHGTPGNIVDTRGHVLGRHGGYEHFTVGQRKGIGVSGPSALYVTAIRPTTAEVVVGPREELATRRLHSSRGNWFDPAPRAGESRRYFVQVRAHHQAVPAIVTAGSDGESLVVEFEEAEPAIAPGQLAVFYDGDVVAGSCWIEGTESRGPMEGLPT
jgi:tRNA-specific 2-thiouridylase